MRGGDAQAAQAEADRGDAADIPRLAVNRQAVGSRTIPDEARGGIGLLPEELTRPPREVVEKPVVFGRKGGPLTPGLGWPARRGTVRRAGVDREQGKAETADNNDPGRGAHGRFIEAL
jgi:hypothetical protein